MDSKEIRRVFLAYFKSCGYTESASASLVPAGDPTLLFTNAGMVPFKDYFLGLKSPKQQKMTTSQKCVRAGGKHNDLEQVGMTARHHTFFEMLGNFVFSGANKETAIQEAWTLITKHYQIPQEKLWVTVFYDDEESLDIWVNKIGVDADRVIKCGEEDNFWSMGAVGPCGPCTEIFYDHGESVAGGPPGSEDADGDRFTEIWNLVFMQYEMLEDGTRVPLASMGLDTGMGLERLSAVMQSVHNNFESDLFTGIIDSLHQQVGKIDLTASRVIADHIRSAVFLIVDQVYPSNEGRGYVLRRIIRRAMAYAYRNGVTKSFFHELTPAVAEIMGEAYPEINEHIAVITEVIKDEELRFHTTIAQGMRILQSNIDSKTDIDGETAFMMYDTYGFPLDIAKDVAKTHGLFLDEKGYHLHMEKQRERSRDHQTFAYQANEINLDYVTDFTGHTEDQAESTVVCLLHENAETSQLEQGMSAMLVTESTPFYAEGGGQIGDLGIIQSESGIFTVTDTQKYGKTICHIGSVTEGKIKTGEIVKMSVDAKRRDTMANHSATHLVHAALRAILGKHVVQKGSLVNHERLRFDFTHSKPLTDQEIVSIERMVNDHIRRNHQQICEWVSLQDARNMDIMALFDEKYEDSVRIVRFGEFSAELCGGTHVQATGEIGLFKLISETGIASGVRRIEALTGSAAIDWLQSETLEKQRVAKKLKCDATNIHAKVEQLVAQNKKLKKSVEAMEQEMYKSQLNDWVAQAKSSPLGKVVMQSFKDVSVSSLRTIHDMLKSSLPAGLIILQSEIENQVAVVVGSVGCQYKANDVLKLIVATSGGKGGGSPSLAQGMMTGLAVNDEQLLKLLQE